MTMIIIIMKEQKRRKTRNKKEEKKQKIKEEKKKKKRSTRNRSPRRRREFSFGSFNNFCNIKTYFCCGIRRKLIKKNNYKNRNDRDHFLALSIYNIYMQYN